MEMTVSIGVAPHLFMFQIVSFALLFISNKMENTSLIKEYSIPDEFINICYEEAEKGLSKKEVPVGCLFVRVCNVKEPEIIMKDHNRTNEYKSALKHAEMNCLRELVSKYPNEYREIMKDCVVMLTLEPCIMCCRMLRMMQVKAIIFGAYNDRFGGAGSVYSVHNNSNIQHPIVNCRSELDHDRAIKILQDFYDQTNENAPKKITEKSELYEKQL